MWCVRPTVNSCFLPHRLQDLSQAAASNPPRGIKGRCVIVVAHAYHVRVPIAATFSLLYRCMGSAHGAVLECVVSESYICLLLEEGQICRVAYSEEHPKEKRYASWVSASPSVTFFSLSPSSVKRLLHPTVSRVWCLPSN